MGKNMKNIPNRDILYRDMLYLGSQSASRQSLLKLADINFKVLTHKSSECVIEPADDFEKYVIAIACDKMQHLQLPEINSQEYNNLKVNENRIFVLTADSLIKTANTNQILGKPKDLEHAREMLRIIRDQSVDVLTGCCLQVMNRSGQHWELEKRQCWATGARVEFSIDEENLDLYFAKAPLALYACGAGVIEGIGQSFLKSIKGSYTAVLGLPLFELRQKLKEFGFKFDEDEKSF
jgi:septum formation protein